MMKKFLLVCVSLSLSLLMKAQEIDNNKAIGLLIKNSSHTGLTAVDLENSIISNAYFSKVSGIELVYLQQSFKGLPVFNQINVLAFSNSNLVSNKGSRIHSIEEKTKSISETPAFTAEEAVRAALSEKKIFNHGPLISSTLIPGRKYGFGKAGIANENITAELLWVPLEDGKEVRLAWQVYLVPRISADYWMIRVDAHSNKVIDENNLTVYCNWEEGGEHQHDAKYKHPYVVQPQPGYGVEQQESLFDFSGLSNTTSRINENYSPALVNSATYRVVPFPVESPKHTGGTPVLRSNPWTLAPGNATSLNWHSNGTSDFNYTRGNNVWAQEDVNGNNGTGLSPVSVSSPDPLEFNYIPDFNVDPRQATPVQNQQFNTTNLFYWNNIMHDITYQYGFDEVAGNFQANNLGRGGAGNDYVLADAQDGSGVNNANFSAPADGSSGRMQMYLWDPIATLTVNSPGSVAGQYNAVESNFSTANKLSVLGPKTGQVVYYNDNAAGTTHLACAGAPANNLTGKIALIDRANCNFTIKVKNAQTAGAIAVIMVNNVQGNPIIMGGTDNTINIPAVMISITDGFLLAAQLANNLNVTLSVGKSIDGDVDNGVIAHEFTHGVSIRLTGGPAQSSCLSNAEQMGEGWSDYFSLMVTQNWAGSDVNTGFNTSRGIGTYAFGQLPTGLGIRTQKYSTDMDINSRVYTSTLNNASPHDKGEIWCAALWDMTWNIIQQVNAINPNIYDASGAGGNIIAMKLVMEGMKLQPCSPGFIDGRDAILKADSILYGGVYNCAIREAFRRRGMGLKASQGSSSNVTDQVPDYTPYVTVQKTQNVVQIPEGQNIIYANRISSCSPVTNYILRDTLPSNVTYVSGGTYDAANRVVSFPVNFTAGQTQVFSFTVSVNTGSYFAPQTLLDEQVAGSTIPATLTASSSTSNTWSVSSAQSQSSPNSFFTPDAGTVSDQKLETSAAIALGAGQSALSFNHRYITQKGFDGGVVEISTDNGTTWVDLGNKITAGYYTGNLATGSGNPIEGRPTWTGTAPSFIRSSVNLSSYANQSAKLRFRFGSNSTTGDTGWFVDDILLKREAVVNMRSSLFNNAGARVSYSDTVTVIVLTTTCTNVSLTTQPSNSTVCAGNDATFSVVVDGSAPAYQWQVSTDGGTNYTNITGATAATLTLTAVTPSMNNNRYRVIISNACPSSITSAAAILTANTPAAISAQPANTSACEGGNAIFSVTASGNTNIYQWQVSTDGGTTFTNISGATGTSLTLTGVSASQNGNQYHVVISSCNPVPLNSSNAILTVSNQASIIAQPVNTPACNGGNATFSVNATGSTLGYQWQVSTDGGVSYTNIPGATSATLTLTPVNSGLNNNRYRVVISNACSADIISNAGILTVSEPATISSQPVNAIVCEGGNTSFTATATGTNISYQWQVSTDGGITFTNITGAITATLSLTGVNATLNGNQYHVNISSCSPVPISSSNATLTVNSLAAFTTQPVTTPACTGGTALFSVTATGSSVNYQWQVSTDGGVSFTDIIGATNPGLTLNPVTSGMNNNRYRVIISNSCTAGVTSNEGLLVVSDPASLTAQPANAVVCEGGSTSFSVTATGTNISYQWQVSTDGGITYTDISGATGATLALNGITASQNNNRYRVVIFSCSATGLNSADAVLSVNNLASISNQPVNASVCNGADASFSITAAGTNINYQWQISTDGGVTYTDITGATGNTLTLTGVTLSMNNNRYRVMVSNSCPSSVTSTEGILTVTGNASIAVQPASTAVCEGFTASFTATAAGSAYQWQVSTDGGITFTDISGATTTTLNLPAVTLGMNGNQYRLVVSGCTSTGLNSEAVTLTVNGNASITAQPANSSTCVGSSATFSATAAGNNPGYQWEESTDGGVTFALITGATAATLTLNNVTSGMNNNQYRVVVSNTCTAGLISNAAVLTVNAQAVITSQPAGTTICPGNSTSFSVTSSGPGITYQWQVSTDGGTTFTNLNGETGNTLNLASVTASMDNYQYRVLIFSTCDAAGLASNAAVLTVSPAALISLQPADFSGCADATATFTATVSGNSLLYQWQVSTDGGTTYANITGETNATLTLSNISVSMNNNRYRLVIGANPCGTTSNAAILIVQPSPVVTISANPHSSLYPGLTTTLTATSNPPGSSYNWYKNGILIPGATGNQLMVNFEERGIYSAKDQDGCDNLSNLLNIADSSTNTVFIYPNPNSGQFLVQYFSGNTSPQKRTITLYDAKGARVYSKSYTVSIAYERMDVIIKNMASGTYMLILTDANGKRLATGKVVKL